MSSYCFEFNSIQDLDVTTLESFHCAEDSLRSFLIEDAREYDLASITKTTVVKLDRNDEIVAFFSLSADAVQLSSAEAFELALPFKAPTTFFPAVKITKLAIATNFQGNGMGAELIKHIEGLVYGFSMASAAVRLLTVDALNKEKVIDFYERQGFLSCVQDTKMRREQRHKPTIPMYKDIFSS